VSLPLFELLEPSDTVSAPGELIWEGPHEKAAEAHQKRYEIPEGHVILTTWQGKLHEVIYQTPLEDETASAHRNASLFDHYGDGNTSMKSWTTVSAKHTDGRTCSGMLFGATPWTTPQ